MTDGSSGWTQTCTSLCVTLRLKRLHVSYDLIIWFLGYLHFSTTPTIRSTMWHGIDLSEEFVFVSLNHKVSHHAAASVLTPSVRLHTFIADFTGTDKVALVPHQDDWCLRLGLPEEEAELGGAVETSPVSHREDKDAHIALQSGQVLRTNTHTHTQTFLVGNNKTSRQLSQISPDYVNRHVEWQLNRCGMSGSHNTLCNNLLSPPSGCQFIFGQHF